MTTILSSSRINNFFFQMAQTNPTPTPQKGAPPATLGSISIIPPFSLHHITPVSEQTPRRPSDGSLAKIDVPYRLGKSMEYFFLWRNQDVYDAGYENPPGTDLYETGKACGMLTGFLVIIREFKRVLYGHHLEKLSQKVSLKGTLTHYALGKSMSRVAKEEKAWGITRIVGGLSNGCAKTIQFCDGLLQSSSVGLILAGLVLNILGDLASTLRSLWDLCAHSIRGTKAIYRLQIVQEYEKKFASIATPEVQALIHRTKIILKKQIRNNFINSLGHALIGFGRALFMAAVLGGISLSMATPIGWGLFTVGALSVIGLLLYKCYRARKKKIETALFTPLNDCHLYKADEIKKSQKIWRDALVHQLKVENGFGPMSEMLAAISWKPTRIAMDETGWWLTERCRA